MSQSLSLSHDAIPDNSNLKGEDYCGSWSVEVSVHRLAPWLGGMAGGLGGEESCSQHGG